MQSMFPINILILGKSGVGKSSLLNYLFGREVAKTGTGRPVTGEGIFRLCGFEHNGARFAIFDSWGLEADKAERWKNLIEGKISARRNKEISEWFHTILYCVDAKQSRLEDFEIKSILQPLEQLGNRVIFALTKSDIASAEEKNALRRRISEHFPKSRQAELSCVEKVLRGGRRVAQSGKEELLACCLDNLVENCTLTAFHRFGKDLSNNFDSEKNKFLSKFSEITGKAFIFAYDEECKRKTINSMQSALVRSVQVSCLKLKKDLTIIQSLAEQMEMAFHIYPDFGLWINNSLLPESARTIEGWDNNAGEYIRDFFLQINPLLRIVIGGRSEIYKTQVSEAYDTASRELHDKILSRANLLRDRILDQVRAS